MDVYLGQLLTLQNDYGWIEDGLLAVENGKIKHIGKRQEALHLLHDADMIHDFRPYFISPALIDCHTHLIYGGNRAHEFEARLNGASYAEIAAAGGGIMSTVRATRSASAAELFASASKRLRCFMQEGVGTVEIKSGYGLDLASECKMLQVAQDLAAHHGVHVQKNLPRCPCCTA